MPDPFQGVSVEEEEEEGEEGEEGEGKDVFRKKTPELRGLKILGKIDTQKFERSKKKKKAPTAAVTKKKTKPKPKVPSA